MVDAQHVVANEALIHAADLLDVKRAVRKALAAEEDELAENFENRAVVDRGDAHRGAPLGVDGRAAAGRPAFEKRIGVGIEELATPRWQMQIAMMDAAVDGAKQGQQAIPGAEAAGHRVGMKPGVVLELLEEA